MPQYHLLVFLCLFLCPIVFASAPVENVSDIDWKTLQWHLMYAYSSYCTVGLQNWTCYWCTLFPDVNANVTEIFYDEATNIYGWVGHRDTEIIVSFRGTQLVSFKNWLDDLDFGKEVAYTNFPNATVHEGFLYAYNAVENQVMEAVAVLKNEYPEKGILVTGHSLGAALSILAAVNFTLAGLGPVRVLNFGLPRVGNPDFAVAYYQLVPNTIRVVNQADLVAHLPPTFLGYQHVARELWFPKDNINFQLCDESGEDPNCSDSLYLPDSLNNHLQYLGYDERDGHQYGCGQDLKK